MDKTEQFINKAISVHGDKYGYSKALYTNNRTNLIINCPIHGDFQQPPERHLSGAGCYQCGRLRTNASKLLTKDMFITRAVNKHGNKYGYEKVNFVKVSDKVTIHCNTCNKDFDQSVNNHLAGSGCPNCVFKIANGARKLSGEDFIKRSILKHGDKYGYEKVNYIDASTKVPILCKRCNEYFEQAPRKHMIGQGHAKCSNTKTGEQFITEAKAKHGDKYGYDKVNYVGIESPVIITCPTHGDFTQTPHGHLKGYGCQKCGRATTGEKTRNNADEYFEQAKIKHNDKFDYSKAIYVSLSKPLTIICPVHGEFTQRADGHLKHGCEQCHYETKLKPHDEFLAVSKAIHGDTYIYDKTKYERYDKNVIITCRKHGDFEKIPSEHIRTPTRIHKPGGCPVCTSSNGEQAIYNLLTGYGLKVTTQHKLPGYKYRYDFFLPELNLLIEYDGPQHYKAVPFWGGVEYLKSRQRVDKEKDHLATLYNHRLIRIPYTVIEDIETYLPRVLMQHIKYKRDNLYFRNFLTFSKHYNLPGDATPKEYEQYIFTPSITI